MNLPDSITDSWNSIFLILNGIYLATAIIVAISVVLDNRNPTKTISWVVVLFVLPILGLILYFVVGKNYRKEKIFSRKGHKDYERIRALSDNQIIDLQDKSFIENGKVRSKLPIINLLLRNSKALLTKNNRVEILNNGDQTFNAIFAAIRKARKHIHLEFYIIEDDKIGNEIRELLISKAREGVKVRMIFDDVGSWKLKEKYIRSLRAAGVEIHPFMPVRIPFLANRINYRNHRKIIVVDGNSWFCRRNKCSRPLSVWKQKNSLLA
jgi:cardiolipin synthase A/B